jgi:hypothetical protein
MNMSRLKKSTSKLRKAQQPPLSRAGAPSDANRAEPNPGDRVEGWANFGKPTGEFGTVERTNQHDAVVKWDGDGRTRLHQPWLKKV